jgi:hypothetical protein
LGFQYLGVNDVSIVSRYPIVATIPASGGSAVTIELSPSQRVHLFNCHLAAYPYGPYSIREGREQTFVINQENQTRMPALNQLLNAMAPYLATDAPCFLVGDFNAPTHLDYANYPWPTSLACYASGLLDAYEVAHPDGPTYPPAFAFNDPGITWTPMVSQEPNNAFDRIDFVYFSDGDDVTVAESTELDGRNSASPWPSDHRAVLARFTLIAPGVRDKASQPSPGDGATNVELAPTLSWLAGSNTSSHRIHFGTNSPGAFRTSQAETTFAPGALFPGTTYYWRVDEVKAAGVVTGDVWSFTTRAVNVYEWDFARGTLAPALGDGVLSYADGNVTANLTRFGTSDGAVVPHLNGMPMTYLRAPRFAGTANGYHVTLTRSGPNGGGIYLNQFTLVYDLLIPAPLGWTALFNTNPANENDADFYIDPAGKLGIGAIGYSGAGAVTANTWQRVGFVADLAAGAVKYYVNGAAVFTGGAALDGRHSLYSNIDPGPDLLLFNEGDPSGIYTHELFVSGFFLTDRALSAAEMAALGGPKARGIAVPPVPIRLSATFEGTSLHLAWTGAEPPYLVQRTFALHNAHWQDFTGPLRDTSFTTTISGPVAFLRVVGQ